MDTLTQLLIDSGFNLKDTTPCTICAEIEDLVKFKLPEDYRYYLENFEAFDDIIGNEFLRLLDLDALMDYNLNYGIFESMPGIIGIGNNGSSEFIGVEFLEDNKHRIVLSPLIDLDKEYNIAVGSSFTDFIQRLANGERWFK
jgi:hypothetical protein